ASRRFTPRWRPCFDRCLRPESGQRGTPVMKYLAILKDSIREALDSMVLLILVVLATLAIVLVGLVSFTPLSAEKTFRQFFTNNDKRSELDLPLFAVLNNHRPAMLNKEILDKRIGDLNQFRLEKVELLRGEPDSPE